MGTFEPHEDFPAIVIDNGSSTCRAGLAGEDIPSCIFSSLVGKRKNLLGEDEFYVGGALQENRELMALTFPIENGIVVNWEDMMKVWDYVFYSKLSVLTEEHPILISEPPLNPRGNREKMAQVMFETYKTPAFFLAYQPLMSLFGSFQNEGIVVTVGDSVTHVVPFTENLSQNHVARRLDFAGRDLTRYLQQLLFKSNYSFTSSHELELVREVKESLCFVAKDRYHLKQLASATESKCAAAYTLPDGAKVQMDSERYLCPELLFEPDNDFHRGKSIPKLIESTINEVDISCRRNMYSCVIISGGSTFFPGFTQRLHKELLSLSPPGVHHVRICAKPERQHLEWIGGSVIASLSSFNTSWISKELYEEYGPSIVCRECLSH
ncbi:actin-85C-like isoform X1 [Biomphalaria pfeifferi]|uniref:Actin-85C-like isoform X1 n=1 Tax=Biomphalaria pfeifferi TaxID=112525 RepID=A0AAD8B486_BIOPF|nr:actin-85C-like isoform X1 [Biomphalaria pfeifferi]